jgi:alanyl-tRNA synthetase
MSSNRALSVSEIRQKFLDFFAQQGHTIVSSSPLVPANDPTLLFTNSGMVQFKDVFLGREHKRPINGPPRRSAVCALVASTMISKTWATPRVITRFLKCWATFPLVITSKKMPFITPGTLLTEVYKLPKEKLWVTVYQEDDEAYGIWANEIGVPRERIVRIGDNKGARYASDNFWQMADTGPCGPCSEIFYDHGPDVWGGPPGTPEADGDRYIESLESGVHAV